MVRKAYVAFIVIATIFCQVNCDDDETCDDDVSKKADKELTEWKNALKELEIQRGKIQTNDDAQKVCNTYDEMAHKYNTPYYKGIRKFMSITFVYSMLSHYSIKPELNKYPCFEETFQKFKKEGLTSVHDDK